MDNIMQNFLDIAGLSHIEDEEERLQAVADIVAKLKGFDKDHPHYQSVVTSVKLRADGIRPGSVLGDE